MVEIPSARPPTPPRTASRTVIDENQIASPLIVSTPKASPFETIEAGSETLSRSSKRVNFSPWPKYIKPPTFTSASQPDSDIKNIPSTDSKPAKSILKTTQSPIPVWSPNVNTFTAESLAMLLESVIQQLAGESTTSRLDAYMQFFGALRTYDGIPAGQEIGDKLNLITEFIQRDVNRDLTNAGIQDTNLANQALKLTAAFIWHPQISTRIPDDFKTSLVDHATTTLDEIKAPKSVLTHYMSILSTQNFSPKVMTNARVNRLLKVLQHIGSRISGNGIISHRLNAYQRLWVQAKPVFLSQPNLWIENLFRGMLHHVKDTRDKAIAFGFRIAAEVGPNATISKSVREFFDHPLEHDRKIVAEIRERMTRMMTFTESGIHVPQIWSVTILLLRNKRWNLEHWHHYKEWLLVLQKCFNCSEPLIKAEAIIGWSRFVSVVGPEECTSRSLLKMLGKPVLSQFDRRKSEKSASPPSQLALNSYHILLYYTFRPSATYQHLDFIWEEYVLTPSSGIFSSIPALSDCLSRVVSNLLWSSQAKLFTEGRIDDANKMEADELPSADSKWVRSRCSNILRVFENLFKSSTWVDGALATSNVALAWSSLCSAISLASSKEITSSGESMQAVAGILGLLHRLWLTGPSSVNANSQDIFLERFRYLSTVMISSIGSISVTEKLFLKYANEQSVATGVSIDPHRPPGTSPESPVLHLIRTIGSTGGSISASQSYKDLAIGIIEAACKSKLFRGSCLELLHQCAELCTADTGALMRDLELSDLLWAATAQAASNALQSFPIESARERDGSVSRDYDNVTKILSSGVDLPDAFQEWSNLLESFVRVVRTEKGVHAVASIILEPMAECIMHLHVPTTYLPSRSLLIHSSSIPFLQGTGLGVHAGGSQPTSAAILPNTLLKSVSRTLEDTYAGFDASGCEGFAVFIEALTSFLGTGVPQLQCQVLQILQPSIGIWLRDESHKTNGVGLGNAAASTLFSVFRALSSATLHVLHESAPYDPPSLKTFEPIVLAGFESSHNFIIKGFLDFWKSTFASKDDTLTQAAQNAESRLRSQASPLQDDAMEIEAVPPPLPHSSTGLANGSHHMAQQPYDSEPSSSPVEKIETNISKGTEEVNEPQLPSNLQSEAADTQTGNAITTSRRRLTRREMFSMIESIQSSSPATTPRKLGFNTPPHLRRLQSGESAPELLLTPSLAPAENEDGFFGSSPTPGTRDPTPATKSNVSIQVSQDAASSQEVDPPSSPPEISSQSPSPKKGRNHTRNVRRKAAKARKALVGNLGAKSTVNSPATSRLATENDTASTGMDDVIDGSNNKENASSTPQPNGETPGRRLRSARGKEPGPVTGRSPAPQVDSPDRTPVPKSRNSKSGPGSSAKRKQNSHKPAPEPSVQAMDTPSDAQTDSVMDSSEETETQIASQLGLDLELAVEVDDKAHITPTKPVDEPSLRKRKRDEEDKPQATAPKTDRRRSTRLSTVKDGLSVEVSDLDGTRALSPAVSHVSQSVSPVKSISPAATRRSARNSQRRESTNPLSEPIPAVQDSPATVIANDETPRPSKRSRKSARLGDQSVPGAIGGSEPPSASRATSSRKTRSQQEAINPNPLPQPQFSSLPTENNSVIDALSHQSVDVEMVPESLIVDENTSVQDIPVSTEEATDSQVSEPEQSIQNGHGLVEPDTEMDLGLNTAGETKAEPSDGILEQAAAPLIETQSHEPSPPQLQPIVTETGITQSLKNILGDMQSATLGPEALREIDDLLFNIRVHAHDASRRHNT
ncbi:unnamed protein product [Penicillium olsonii]|nr:unnamed protein product [Penicillium olsonii]